MNFFIRAVVISKAGIVSWQNPARNTSLYETAIREVFIRAEGTIEAASVRIDGSGSRSYRQVISKFLREEVNTQKQVVGSVKLVNSRGDQLIQLADMVAGAIRLSYSSDSEKSQLYRSALTPLLKSPKSQIWLSGK